MNIIYVSRKKKFSSVLKTVFKIFTLKSTLSVVIKEVKNNVSAYVYQTNQ